MCRPLAQTSFPVVHFMSLQLTIIPYGGAPPLAFGISSGATCALAGEPLQVNRRVLPPLPPGTRATASDFRRDPFSIITGANPAYAEHHYPGISLAFDKTDRLCQIGFGKNFEGSLILEGIDVLKSPHALETLVKLDGKPYHSVGFVMLMNLGVRLGGYHETADEGRTVSLFERGRYDNSFARFQAFDPDSPSCSSEEGRS